MYIDKNNQNRKVGLGIKSCQVLFLLFMLVLGVEPSAAVPLGLPPSTAKLGYSAAYVRASVDDPDGDTQTASGVQPLGLVYTDWLIGDFRYWSELYYYATELDAATNRIGQDVKRYGVRFSAQKNLRFMQAWAPWLGLGLDVSQANYSNRHTVDSEGFLADSFDDRDEVAVSLLVNVISEWSVAGNWSVGLKLEQSIPISSDISEFLVSGAVLYRY